MHLIIKYWKRTSSKIEIEIETIKKILTFIPFLLELGNKDGNNG